MIATNSGDIEGTINNLVSEVERLQEDARPTGSPAC
jgi:hypothetical protein